MRKIENISNCNRDGYVQLSSGKIVPEQFVISKEKHDVDNKQQFQTIMMQISKT